MIPPLTATQENRYDSPPNSPPTGTPTYPTSPRKPLAEVNGEPEYKKTRGDLPLPNFGKLASSSSSTIQLAPIPTPATSGMKKFTSPTFTPPSTPVKKRTSESLGGFKNLAFTVSCTRQQQYTRTPGNIVDFTISAIPGAKGQHSQAYTISSARNLFSGYQNDQLLFKAYQQEVVLNARKNVEMFARNSLKQYGQLLAIQFPIARILNVKTIFRDGYFLVEKIPHPFEISWDENTPIVSLDEETKLRLFQVKVMFASAFDQKIAVDLSADNVRVDNQGRVVLIDFMEEDETNPFSTNPFGPLVAKCLLTFSRGNSEIEAFLDPRISDRLETDKDTSTESK